MDASDTKAKLVDALRSFDTVMVATTARNGTIHARPMAVAEVGEDGDLWFVTSKETAKTDEADKDGRTVVTGQSKTLYVSVSGALDVVEDRERVARLWKESWKAWFPRGKDDPSLVLMCLHPEIGEYWDERGTNGVRYVFEVAKAWVDGERPSTTRDQHAKVPLSR